MATAFVNNECLRLTTQLKAQLSVISGAHATDKWDAVWRTLDELIDRANKLELVVGKSEEAFNNLLALTPSH